MKLTPHFSLEEFTHSDTAVSRGINNSPPHDVELNIKFLAEFMEKVREVLGNNPIVITSGYRSPAVNAAVGGSSTSQHLSGLACDFTCPAFGAPIDICKAIMASGLKYDQLIHEHHSWVHISIAKEPRMMALTIDNNGTRHGIA